MVVEFLDVFLGLEIDGEELVGVIVVGNFGVFFCEWVVEFWEVLEQGLWGLVFWFWLKLQVVVILDVGGQVEVVVVFGVLWC